MKVKDKIIWITGASSGIGEALAYELDRYNARLILSSRREKELKKVMENCTNPENHFVLPLDLEDGKSLKKSVKKVLGKYRYVDILIHSGGISQRSLVKETNINVDRKIMEVNFFGAVALTKEILPVMLERNSGHIVVISSVMGKFGTSLRSAYAASKHALQGYFDSLRSEVWDNGLRVTIICPGFVKTNISINALKGDGTKHNTMDEALEKGLCSEECAKKIIKAIEKDKSEAIVARKEKLGVLMKRFLPGVFERIIRKVKVT